MNAPSKNLAPANQTELVRKRKTAAARLSVLSNTALVVLKLAVGFWSGSVSILSEAFHSASDLIASGIALFAVRISDTPPDDKHPYGHGKAESLSGLAEALLIFGAAVYIIYEALHKLSHPEPPAGVSLRLGIGLMAFSATLNFILSRYLHRVASETDSLALAADAEHLRTDVVTSIGVFAGLILIAITRKAWFDSVTALTVAALILRTTWELAAHAMHLLLDARLPEEEEAIIRQILEAEPQVLGYHKLRTRKSGAQRHADVHVQAADECTLLEAHDLAERLEDQMRGSLSSLHVNIHMEPYHAEIKHQKEAHHNGQD